MVIWNFFNVCSCQPEKLVNLSWWTNRWFIFVSADFCNFSLENFMPMTTVSIDIRMIVGPWAHASLK